VIVAGKLVILLKSPAPTDKKQTVLERISEALRVFSSQSVEQTLTESFETPNPTSVEFEREFSDLMKAALQQKGKRLVLVLDNLDRVAPRDALDIWATLQTFLGARRKDAWQEQRWVVVPYDPKGLRALREASIKAEEAPRPEDAHSSFVQKTFQVALGIPPALLSDWRQYLLDLLQEALPEHPASDFHDIYRLLLAARDSEWSSPTPRNLKLVVNEVGILHRIWQHEIPLAHLCAYVLCRQRNDGDIRAVLLSGEAIDTSTRSIIGDAEDSFVMCAFNVHVRLARQFLLRDSILSALLSGKGDELKELAVRHAAGFWEVLEHVMSTQTATQVTQVRSIVKALAGSGILEGESRAEAGSIRNAIRQVALAVRDWTPFDQETASAILELLPLLGGDEEAANQVLEALSSTPIAKGDEQIETWTAALLLVLRGIRSACPDVLTSPISVPSSLEQWNSFAEALASEDPEGENWDLIRPTFNPNELDAALATMVQNGSWTSLHSEILQVSKASFPATPWSAVIPAFLMRLRNDGASESAEVGALLDGYWIAYGALASYTDLEDLTSQGHLYHHFHQAYEGRVWTVAARCLLAIISAGTPSPPATGQSVPGHRTLSAVLSGETKVPELVSSVTELLEQHHAYGLILSLVPHSQSFKPFTLEVLRPMSASPRVSEHISSGEFLEHWPLFLESVSNQGQPFRQLVSRLCAETPLGSDIKGEPFNSILFDAVAEALGLQDREFAEACLAGVKGANESDWRNGLRTGASLLRLLLRLLDNAVSVNLGTAYLNALKVHPMSIAQGDSGWPPTTETWRRLVGALPSKDQGEIRNAILDAALRVGVDTAATFFRVLGPEIADPVILKTRRETIKQLLKPLVTRHKEEGLEWFAQLASQHPRLLQRGFSSSDREDLRRAIKSHAGRGQKSKAARLIQEIATSLNVR
jgi:hypothetical protein